MRQVGVISFQGDFHRHLRRCRELGVSALPVRAAGRIDDLDALIIPGGESTTIGMLLERFDMLGPIRDRIRSGMPVLGTCAGAILLSDAITGSEQPRIGGLHAEITRNAYGRQVESFEAPLRIDDQNWPRWQDDDVLGVFIRAPIIRTIADDVTPLLTFEDRPVLVRQGTILAATFHPELTPDPRVHEYFLEQVAGP